MLYFYLGGFRFFYDLFFFVFIGGLMCFLDFGLFGLNFWGLGFGFMRGLLFYGILLFGWLEGRLLEDVYNFEVFEEWNE